MKIESRKPRTELIVALDVDNLKRAEELVDLLYPRVKLFKVGSQLFTLYGPKAVSAPQKKGAGVFLDLKFHDIPNTVANAAVASVRLGASMFTVHIQGGLEMMQRAREAADLEASKLGREPPLILGVTVLTSKDQDSTIKPLVSSLTKEAKKAGLDGVVASNDEAQLIRRDFGKGLIIVTCGIRLPNTEGQDQKRTATPTDALRSGVDYIVVGRPILESLDPQTTTDKILKQLSVFDDR